MFLPIAEQVILITGASSGIGAALAKMLAEKYPKIRLILSARRQDRLEEVAAYCRQAKADVLVVPTDMTQLDQVKRLAQMALEQYGRVDVLVNNAGYGQMGPLELTSPEVTQRQFSVNLFGPMTLIRSLIPTMRDNGGGQIINVSSIGGRIAFPLGGLYSASKFALEAVSDVLRMELEPFNIRVSVVEPGPVHTEFVDVAKQMAEQIGVDPNTTPYRPAVQKLQSLDRQIERQAWTSEQVAEVILKAMKARHPKPRYIAATGGNILVGLMTKVLPTRIVDSFWQRFYGIDQVFKEWRESKI